MKRLLTWAMSRRYTRRFPNAHLRNFERQLAAANSSPFAAYLSFSDDVAAIGLGTDWRGMVEDVEAEGTRVLGAVPCPGPHADALVNWRSGPRAGTQEYKDDVLNGEPCPSCGAAV